MVDKNLHTIINGCLKGDRKAQAKLFELYLPYVATVCRIYLYDHTYLNDAIHDTFLAVFSNLSKNYDTSKGTFKPWTRKIAINNCLKRNQRNKKQEYEELDDSVIKNMKIGPDVFHTFSEEDLIKVIRSIPESYREVFTLYVIDGYLHKEISKMLNINEAVSRKKLSKARAWLKNKFATGEDEKTSFFKGLL